MGWAPTSEPKPPTSSRGTSRVKDQGGAVRGSVDPPIGLKMTISEISLPESNETSICNASPGLTTVPAEGRTIETPSEEYDRKLCRSESEDPEPTVAPCPATVPIFSFVQTFFAC